MVYLFNTQSKNYIGLNYIKRFATELLTIETGHNFKQNEDMIFTEKDRLCHKANNNCHICSKTCIKKVSDHCHETGNIRGPTCNICSLRCK